MRENRIDWPRFFKPVCVLCMLLGAYWLYWQMSLADPEQKLGRYIILAGGVLFIAAGIFGLIGRPRALVPMLDFAALACAFFGAQQLSAVWPTLVGIGVAGLYLVCCNASTIVGDGEGQPEPDYSELHPYWENMERIKQQFEERDAAIAVQKEAEEADNQTE